MSPHEVRWGIVATGWISNKFSIDLLIDPATRNVSDIKHVVKAVASRSKEKAGTFVKEVFAEAGVTEGVDDVTLYASYDELYADESIDIVYIGTPHSHHYQNCLAALTAGKNVCCEKSLVVNAKQAQALVDLARHKNLFFMEAVWLRFQPAAIKVQELIAGGVIGQLKGVKADLSVDLPKNSNPRMLEPHLAGGALLDLGPYPWTWLALLLLPTASASTTPHPVPKIAASVTKTETGVDASTVAVLQFPQADGRILHGTMTASLNAQAPVGNVVQILGEKGYLEVQWQVQSVLSQVVSLLNYVSRPTYRPRSISYVVWDTPEDYASADGKPPAKSVSIPFDHRPGNIWGMSWEADECARCLRDGKKESDRMPLRDTILMMEVFDEIRRQGYLTYPESIETLDKVELA